MTASATMLIVKASVFAAAVIGLLGNVDMAVSPVDESGSSSAWELLQVNSRRSCTYEGLVYAEGQQVVISEEPCLNCSCRQGSLVCYLHVCRPLPNPPPPECVLVHRKHHCCPELICKDGGTLKKKLDGRSDLIPGGTDTKTDGACVANGTVYAEGSAMHTSGLCDYCYCIRGNQQCTQPQCLLSLEGCTPGYRALSCCPTHYDCSEAIAADTTTTSTEPSTFVGCELNGQFYPEGEMVQTVARSKCEKCYCLKSRIQCVTIECTPPPLGCSPVITSGKCCPTSYNCSGVSELELTEDIFPALDAGNNHLELYTDSKLPQQVTGEGRSNHDGIKGATNSTTTETSTDDSMTSGTTADTTTEEISSETTITATTTDVTTTSTLQPTTVTVQTTPEASGDNNTQERFLVTQTEDNQVTTATTMSDEDKNLATMLTEMTFMTLFPTTMIIPEDMYVANITVHSNVTIVEKDDNITAVNGSLPPIRAIPPEIEAILNITRKKDDDYEYDYNEPSLPPSLPNLRIIPFVAAGAVLEDDDDDVDRPTSYPGQDKHRPTDNPLYYKLSHPNRFSPPVETEGGFVPREPILDGPYYESKYEVPYHTTGLNIPEAHMSVDITVGTIIPPSITLLPKTDNEHCLSDGREFRHGELISEPGMCVTCLCYYGEVLCQEDKCPHVKTGCRRLKEKELGVCCGRVICDDAESPTVVLDRIDITPSPLQTLQQQAAAHLGAIVPPITVADGVVTPDPFRDVIRTEQAPDLPSLIEDMMPYLLEHHASTSITTTTTTTTKPSTTPIQERKTTSATVSFTQTSTFNNSIDPITQDVLGKTSSSSNNKGRPVEKLPHNTGPDDNLNTEEDKDEVSGISLDSVLQFLFSDDETTKTPYTATRRPTMQRPSNDSSTSQKITFTSHNLTATHSSENLSEAQNKKQSKNTTIKINTTPNNQDVLNFMTGSTASGIKDNVIPQAVTTVLNNVNPTASSREPPPGRPPNLQHSQLPAPVSADPGAASGLLKLAGCNIYGRMYRVGRIISELSGPCLECMCTEVGVQCRPLDC
ncbi:uncharacterized protein LOC110828042 isoform X2 [Zootermopsis nevadensis]|uniref:uncharacterized protein LOC110828042 isoform X2 n=1 Tax=Zootermopsis nevadensis TaxID=136037 RepID=UPI000B8EA74A|nr:uncharacterized protein LOC110828042 isoform X2 [Zootermopsis nevadensis]